MPTAFLCAFFHWFAKKESKIMSASTSEKDLFDYLVAEYQRPFTGWDFSYLAGRSVTIRPNPLWNYNDAVVAAMQQAHSVLDMETGGGERFARYLASATHPLQSYATEGYTPNIAVARQTLEPLGVTVYELHDGNHLPFADEQLDLIINRHEAYTPREVLRILKPGHQFITQQIGDQTNLRLHTLLGHERAPMAHPWNVDYAANELQAAGWCILERQEETFCDRYYDIGAVVYYLKGIAWEIPDFSVEKYFPKLVELDRLMQREGYVDVPFQQFFIVAQKP
jgi:SAM-dependent methyltransferase